MTIDTIVQLYGHSKRMIQYVLSTFHDYNQMVNPPAQPQGQPHVLDRDDLNFIDSILAAEPSHYLYEIQDIRVSISTISRTLS